jgi:DNA-binding response OmpR family regulator
MRIMLAEDDPPTRLILKKKLEQLDFEVEQYSDGEEAWEALQTREIPEIALIDWEMPHMDGIELVNKIRSDDRSRSLYIVMLTIRDQNRDVMDSFQIGVDDFLCKPLDLKELRIGLEKGKKMVRSGKSFDERQDIIMENIYDFFEGKGRWK